MHSIYDYTLDELKALLKPSFRAKQVYNWLYKKYVTHFDDMKNLPNDLKESLKKNFKASGLKILKKRSVKMEALNISSNLKMVIPLKPFFY